MIYCNQCQIWHANTHAAHVVFVERRQAPRDRAELKRVIREIRAELNDPADILMPAPFRAILEDRLARVEVDLATLNEAQSVVAEGLRRICRALARAAGGANERRPADHTGGPGGRAA